MDYKTFAKDMTDFIAKCPSMFHSAHSISKELDKAGYEYLKESAPWNLKAGGRYYTTRNNSSVIAFAIPEVLDDYHFQMTAAHSDSPTFKVKTISELEGPNDYLKLNVEGYGGMIASTWMDRPLSLAGRVLVKTDAGLESRLFYPEEDLLLIPNVPIHFNREVNKHMEFNNQIDMCPLYSAGELKKGSFDEMVAKFLGCKAEDIYGKDLFLVNREKACFWGYKEEFVSSPKLDDLECAYTTLRGFIEADHKHKVDVYCCFDNEEVGSNTKQGAMSTFMLSTLQRINEALGKTQDEYYQAIAGSFMVSADNAHAVHPNHPEKTDSQNTVFMNKGIVIKEAANQKYTTDAFSRAVFTHICKKAGVPVQFFANKSDIVGGSTLGNLSNTQVSVHAVDVGLAQLAMHSSYETAGAKDPLYMKEAIKTYFETNIHITDADSVTFE